MRGAFKFEPESGAELDRRPEYPGTIPLREALDGTGALSNGELTSRSGTALLEYFKRCHTRHHQPGPEHTQLYYDAWEAIQALRESDPWDCWLWFALLERLSREGYDADWMLAHAEPRCPRCSSQLRVVEAVTGYDSVECAVNCGQDGSDRTFEVVDRICEVYNAAFAPEDEDGIESLRSIRPR